MIYKLRADVIEDEDGRKRIAYGIDVFQLVRSVPAVFFGEEQALAFLELCNEGQPSAEHLDDIIHDTLIKQKAAHP